MLPRAVRKSGPRRRFYVAFAVGGRRRALPTEAVAAVGVLGPVTRLPTADPRRRGVFVHQGRVVALVALDEGGPAAVPGHFVLPRAGDGSVAFPVDELIGLRTTYDGSVPAGLELLDPAELPRSETAEEAS